MNEVNLSSDTHSLEYLAFIPVPCPSCKSEKSFVAFTGDRHQLGLTSNFCPDCALMFLNPQPTELCLKQFYEQDYRRLYDACTEPDKAYLEAKPYSKRAEVVLQRVGAVDYPWSSWLDIGCADGSLLRALKNRNPTAELSGIEPNPRFAEYAIKNTEANIYNQSLESFCSNSSKTFNVISITHVLEHLPHPKETLKQIHGLLNDDGLLYIEVPNISDPDTPRMGEIHLAHLLYFSPLSLKLLLENSGFKEVSFGTQGYLSRSPSMFGIYKKQSTQKTSKASVLSVARTLHSIKHAISGQRVSAVKCLIKTLKQRYFI